MVEQINADWETLAHKFNHLERGISLGDLKIDDTYSLNLLQPLINGYPFLPFTGSALRPFCLVHMLNDIVINGRKNILEFGSGLSTIMIGRLIRKNNLSASILSVEHDEGWVKVLSGILQQEQLSEVVQLIHAPLAECTFAADNNRWYDTNIINSHMQNRKFDMVIVDGPPAWEKGKEKARYPAIPYMVPKLDKLFSIYLDDANRPGEQSILQQWKKEYSIDFRITGRSLAYFYNRNAFYTEPFSYY